MAQRWAVVRLLDAGMHYAEISRTTGASTATITIDAVNDAPTGPAGGFQLTVEDTPLAFSTATGNALVIGDPDDLPCPKLRMGPRQ